MTFNLISARWLACRRASGVRGWIAPHEITSAFEADPILALDFPRPDWNAAVTELLIGLMSATIPPKDPDQWADLWLAPPPPETLKAALAPLAFAFDFDGDGPRCFQDFDTLATAEPNSIGALVIDAPGENTIKQNKDLFVKRDGITALSFPYAAAAIVTLQTYAPSGGSGHRTSMRGGGPLTLLLAPRRKHPNFGLVSTLWGNVWSNVRTLDPDEPPLSNGFERTDARWPRVFPWLADTRTSSKDTPTLPGEHADPLQAFFGMPRRLRLDFATKVTGDCSLGGQANWGVVASYRTQNYGIMYSGWQHPLSPYYIDKKNGKLPFHPQPGLVTFEDWYAWWGLKDGTVEASNIKAWPARLSALSNGESIDLTELRQKSLRAVGFDMDNMKARGWVDERIPYFEPKANSPKWAEHFRDAVTFLVSGAKTAADTLKYELRRNAWAKWDGKQFKLPDNAPKDAFDEVAAQLWTETQEAFVACLAALHAGDPNDPDRSLRNGFRQQLRGIALRLFDEAAGTDTLAEQNARRLIEARKGLVIALSREGKVASALGIAEAKSKRPRGPGKGSKP